MTSFGQQRDNIGSFGRRPAPAEEPDGPDGQPRPAMLVVDLVVSPDSLQKMTDDVAAAVRRGVELGFASAGTPEIDP